MDDLNMGPGQALREYVAAGRFRVRHWVLYDSRPPRRVSVRDVQGGRWHDGNVTLYVRDERREFNPCLRMYWHTRTAGFECHVKWDPIKCRACEEKFEWGVGTFVACGLARLRP